MNSDTKNKKRYTGAVLLVIIVVLYGITGNMSYDDAKDSVSTYCSMVEQGTWPDYNENYNQVCK